MIPRKVKIKNIIAIGHEGEYVLQSETETIVEPEQKQEDNPIPRLINHINFLAQKTLEAHKRELDNQVEEPATLITRLILNEFSLYTKDRPLTIEQYKEVIGAIADIAKTLPPNIHLVIATLPVIWPNGVLHNVGLYVQSPKREGLNPILHHLDKIEPSNKELKYLNGKNKFYPLYKENKHKDDDDESLSPNIVLKDTAIAINDKNQSGCTIKVKVPSGENIVVTIEFCLEHKKRRGISDTNNLMKQLKRASKKSPQLGSHVISSHSIIVEEYNLIGSPIQADPLFLPKTESIEEVSEPIFGKKWTLYICNAEKVNSIEKRNLKFPPPRPISAAELVSFLSEYGAGLFGTLVQSASTQGVADKLTTPGQTLVSKALFQ